jgi:hypothetical protein
MLKSIRDMGRKELVVIASDAICHAAILSISSFVDLPSSLILMRLDTTFSYLVGEPSSPALLDFSSVT